MRRLLLYTSLVLLLGACGTPWRCTCSSSVEQVRETVDSVGYQTRDLDVPIPEESAADSVSVGDTTTVQTSVAEAKAWVEDGKVHQRIRNRSEQLLRIKLDVPVYFHTEKEYLTRTVTKEVEKPFGWFKKTLMYAGIVPMLAGVAALISVIIRHRNKIQQLFKR